MVERYCVEHLLLREAREMIVDSSDRNASRIFEESLQNDEHDSATEKPISTHLISSANTSSRSPSTAVRIEHLAFDVGTRLQVPESLQNRCKQVKPKISFKF